MGMLQSHMSSANTETITATTTLNHSTGISKPPSIEMHHEWLIDSEASCYVSYCSQLFHKMRRMSRISVVLPNMFHVNVEYMGDVWI